MSRQLALEALTEEAREQFLRIIRSVSPGRRVTVNHLRDLLDAAGIPEAARGGLFDGAVRAGLLRPVQVEFDGGFTDVWVKSNGETAHSSRVRLYERAL